MAINNWRYVVTWWYMDPNGNIIEERQWVPNTNLSTTQTTPTVSPSWNYFSPADVYKLQADGYYNQGDTALGDAYNALWQWSNAFSNSANQINQFYNQLASDVSERERNLAWAKYNLANQLTKDLLSQRQYVMDTFWPQGTLTQEVNRYYDDLWNYLATEAWRQAANIAAQWVHSWASLWSIRAQQNEAYNEAFSRYIQAKEQEINAKQTIAWNLINYMSALRQEYWDTTNAYIISQYQRANDLLNSLSQSIASSNIELANAKLTRATAWWGSSSTWGNWYMTWQDYLALQNYLDGIDYPTEVGTEDGWDIVETSNPNLNR